MVTFHNATRGKKTNENNKQVGKDEEYVIQNNRSKSIQ